jgi:prevent-host-death family protein
MTSVGSLQAKTQLPELLERVVRGEKILITRRGQPVAMLVPPPAAKTRADVTQVVKEMLETRDRAGPTLGGTVTTRQLIEEGRRRR